MRGSRASSSRRRLAPQAQARSVAPVVLGARPAGEADYPVRHRRAGVRLEQLRAIFDIGETVAERLADGVGRRRFAEIGHPSAGPDIAVGYQRRGGALGPAERRSSHRPSAPFGHRVRRPERSTVRPCGRCFARRLPCARPGGSLRHSRECGRSSCPRPAAPARHGVRTSLRGCAARLPGTAAAAEGRRPRPRRNWPRWAHWDCCHRHRRAARHSRTVRARQRGYPLPSAPPPEPRAAPAPRPARASQCATAIPPSRQAVMPRAMLATCRKPMVRIASCARLLRWPVRQ